MDRLNKRPKGITQSVREPQETQPRLRKLQSLIRNNLSRAIGAIRNSPRLQPLHRRYGPIKYGWLLPLIGQAKNWIALHVMRAPAASYSEWAKRCEELRYDRERARQAIDRFRYKPTISLVFPVYNTNRAHLREALDSILNQYYSNWELCICDDGSSESHVREILEEHRSRDRRIKIAYSADNRGISVASNLALGLATGEFVGLVDHDDLLTPDALYEVVNALQESDADLIYSDEDRLDSAGLRSQPHFKPAWSPDLLLSTMYLAHFCVYRRAIVENIGGFRSEFDGSQDYDLALRFTERTNKILHIPKILYHWRDTADSASAPLKSRRRVEEAGRLALIDAMRRRGIAGDVECQNVYGFYRVKRAISSAGRVSIIVLVTDDPARLARCIDCIQAKTDYTNYEIILAKNGPSRSEPIATRQSRHRVIENPSPGNLGCLNNAASREATGDYLLFLSGGAEPIRSGWLEAMLEHAQRPDVGAVGAKLLYADGRIQHAGVLLSLTGQIRYAHRLVNGFTGGGYLNYANVIRNYSAVSGDCLMVRRELFSKLGGFDEENFGACYGDIDFCLRLRGRGYLIVYTPYALIYNHAAHARQVTQLSEEAIRLRERWRDQMINDPYYNPNLSSVREDFSQDFSKHEAFAGAPAEGPPDPFINV